MRLGYYPNLIVINKFVCYLPALSTATAAAAAKSSFGFLGLTDVTTRLAANRLAEATRLKELLLACSEDELLSAIFAGHFFVLSHFAYPPLNFMDILLWTFGLLNGGSSCNPRVLFLLPILLVRFAAYRPWLSNSRSQLHYTLQCYLSKALLVKIEKKLKEELRTYMWKDQIGNTIEARYIGCIEHIFTLFAVIAYA
jgi:hypothetical protein